MISLATSEETYVEIQLGTIIAPEEVEEVPLFEFEEVDENSEVIGYLQHEDEIIILEELKTMSLVELISEDDAELETDIEGEELEVISGYVHNDFIEIIELDEQVVEEEVISEDEEPMEEVVLEESTSDDETLEDTPDAIEEQEENVTQSVQMFSTMKSASSPVISGVALKEQTAVYSSQSRSSSVLKSYTAGTILKYRALNSSWYAATVYIKGIATSGYIHSSDVDGLVSSQNTLQGIALQSTTKVFASPSTNSTVLRSYSANTVLKYTTFSENWYQATVFANGKWNTGYIHRSHVESRVENQETLQGIALQSPTNVYASTSINSKVHRSYAAGSLLTYRTFSKDWYQATVYISGKKTTGYIHRSHVESRVENQETLQGIALQSPTNVYASTSTNSKVHRSYAAGSLLTYRTFSKDWYQATVYISGKKTTGYIHRSHVESRVANQETLKGIALQSPTNVYANTSNNSKVHKSYGAGTLLTYKTFTKDWYQATVYINGKKTIGYIHRSHVENGDLNPQTLRGIALQSSTNVYASTSTSSKIHRTYSEGTILKYSTFTKDWYQATVSVNGKWETGYIHRTHVENIVGKQVNSVGFGNKQPTKIYQNASKSSNVIKEYPLNSKLSFKTLSSKWHEVTVSVSGKYVTGYLYTDDVSNDIIDTSGPAKYNYTFKKLVDDQFARSNPPNKDGGGSKTSTRGEVEFFMNPANFPEGTSSHFQFLILNENAGLNPTELNNTILKGKGILDGHGKAFVDAGKQNNMNEAYLISHALLETGNGTSTLAKGVWVDQFGTATKKDGQYTKTADSKFMVYNVYGYGAANSCPTDCGAQTAFNEGWFTPQQAIIGGSNKIESGYIGNGLNTLYKMRWNPANPGHWRQYATHTKWAYGQTSRIASIYNQLNDYTLKFDVPSFKDMPNYDTGAAAKVTGSAVNFRTGAGTSNSIITRLAINTNVTIIGSTVVGSEGWYKVIANGTTGWLAADYVSLVN